jgi:hypothetical protein
VDQGEQSLHPLDPAFLSSALGQEVHLLLGGIASNLGNLPHRLVLPLAKVGP